MSNREEWTDARLSDHMQALRELPTVVAKLANQVDECSHSTSESFRLLEKLSDGLSDRDRRLHDRIETVDRDLSLRIDQLNDKLSDRDREYRRNIVLALGPIAVVALLIAAKVVFGIDLPGVK